jgi:hypothetical protein
MGKLILLSGACLLACGTLAGPAVAKSKSGNTCNAKSNSFLVGQDVSETQKIWDAYRLLEKGADAGPAQPDRLTIVYDKGTGRILSVSCG